MILTKCDIKENPSLRQMPLLSLLYFPDLVFYIPYMFFYCISTNSAADYFIKQELQENSPKCTISKSLLDLPQRIDNCRYCTECTCVLKPLN